MEEGKSIATNLIWAITLIAVVLIIVGAIYYSGVLNMQPKDTKIDVEISTPAPAN